MSSRSLAFVLTLGTTAVLAAMVIVSAVTGASQEAHEYYTHPVAYAADLLEHRRGLRLLMGLDVTFLVAYTAMFAALASHLQKLGRPFTRLALAFLVGTAVLDAIEDHQILTALDMAEQGTLASDAWIAWQQVLSATKFSLSYIGMFLFGIAIPRTTKLGWALTLFLTVGTLVTAIFSVASHPDARTQLDMGRWLGYVAGFALLATWLRATPDATT